MLFLFLLFLSLAHAQSSSQNCSSPRSSIQTLIENLQSDNWKPKLASSCFETQNESLREDLAVQLKQTLDSRGYRVDYDNYSEDPDYKNEQSTLFHVPIDPRLPEIEIVKIGENWVIPIHVHTPIRSAYSQTFSSNISQLVNRLPSDFPREHFV